MKKDKIKIVDEQLNEDGIRRFLKERPADDTSEDFHILLKAYRGLNDESFTQFISFFKEEGRSVSALNKTGQSLYDIVKKHKKSGVYAKLLSEG
ncbi:MAG: PA4642 family protein [Pseudomonadales bacterium]|nr:PA4642 family protein [Pseudomonadales bacterium]